jgi:hypothetical protein
VIKKSIAAAILSVSPYFLKNRKITLVRSGECPPMNQDKLDMQKATQTGPEAWMVDGIESRRAPLDRDLLTYSEIVEALQQRFRGKDFTWAWVAKTLTLVPDAGKLKDDADKDVKVTLKGKDYNCWAVRNLSFYRTAPNATRANSLDGRPTGAPDIDEAGWRMPKVVKLLTDDEIAKLNKLIADAKDRRDSLNYEYLRYQLRLDERAKKKQAAA